MNQVNRQSITDGHCQAATYVYQFEDGDTYYELRFTTPWLNAGAYVKDFVRASIRGAAKPPVSWYTEEQAEPMELQNLDTSELCSLEDLSQEATQEIDHMTRAACSVERSDIYEEAQLRYNEYLFRYQPAARLHPLFDSKIPMIQEHQDTALRFY